MTKAQETSTSAVLSSLVANLILFLIFITGFIVLRFKFKRIYSPKSSYDLVPEEKKPEPLPQDPVRGFYVLLTKPHSFIIQQCGLDGYFFLRYLWILGVVFLYGILMWVVLLPVNATQGKGHTQLDRLSISNVKHSKRYYAHAVMSWLFYGSVVYVIYRELFFFNSFRTAALSTPRYAQKLSSRTVLFQSVPDAFLDEKQFFKVFNGVRRIYVSRNVRKLDARNREREMMSFKLEHATCKLLEKAMKARIKAEKKGIVVENPDDINTWVPENKRPQYKPNGFFSGKVDTINYCREKIPELDSEVHHLQKSYRKARPKNSIFVEFEDQYTAQLAYQSVVHHTPMRMSPAYTGLAPTDIIWQNLRLFWWERFARRGIAFTAIVALVICWAFPVAFVGVISNINNLTAKIYWLRWIKTLPKWFLGVITGVLPTFMLTGLMAVLPIFIRTMAIIAGAISSQHVELYTQKAYFLFLIVNSFLVTALASSATATVVQLIDKPSSALSILASNLPRSSNFYISYLILQGLTVAGGALFQVVLFFLYYILGRAFDNTLRKKYARFSGLGTVAWGTTFPIFTNLACITLAYAIIAPMILLFACVAFGLMYIAYVHNLSYCFVESPDSRGAHYPQALFHTFTGLYLGQICLLGLFVVGKGWGPIVMQIMGLCFTIICHLSLKKSFKHLLTIVPLDCMIPLDGMSHTASYKGESDYKKKVNSRHYSVSKQDVHNDLADTYRVKNRMREENPNEGTHDIAPLLADREFKDTIADNFLVRYIRPDVYLNYRHAKMLMPATYYQDDQIPDNKHAFDQPVISAKLPVLWIPRDPYGWSTHEIEENSKFIHMSDENSGFDAKGNIYFVGQPPY